MVSWWDFQTAKVRKSYTNVDLQNYRSFRSVLSIKHVKKTENIYSLAKICFDTPENGLCKICQILKRFIKIAKLRTFWQDFSMDAVEVVRVFSVILIWPAKN